MHSPSSHGDLDEFEIESPKIDQGDFAQRIRTTVMLDYQDKEQGRDLCGFEVCYSSRVFLLSIIIVNVGGL